MLLCALIVAVWCVTSAFCAELAGLYDGAAVLRSSQGQAWVEHSQKIDSSYSRLNHSAGFSLILEATVLVITAAGFLLFFPACIVMFHRVERRLNTIIREMAYRSDIGTAFLPYEFSPPAARTVDRAQVDCMVLKSRYIEISVTCSVTG
jgi:hypothetical protein